MDPQQNQAIEFEARRRVVDQFTSTQGKNNGVDIMLRPLNQTPDHIHPSVPRTPFTRVAYSRSFTRGPFYRLLEYRFFADPLYLVSPVRHDGTSIPQVVHMFRDHYFCPIKLSAEGLPAYYAPPVRVGSIAAMFQRPVERCFSWGDGFRLDCTAIPVVPLMWIPAEGGVVDGTPCPPMAVGWDTMLAAFI